MNSRRSLLFIALGLFGLYAVEFGVIGILPAIIQRHGITVAQAGGAICGRSGSLRTGHGAVASALRAAQGAGGFVADLQPVQLTVGQGTQLRCADGAACTFCTAASGIFFGGFCFGLVALPSGSRRARHLNGVPRHHIGAGAGRTLVNLDRSYSVLRGVILFQRRSKSGGRSRALGYASA